MKSLVIRGVSLAIVIAALLIILPNNVQAATIRVEAYIDGRSQLIIRGNTAQWQHFADSAPGIPQNPSENFPTIINSANWVPSWSGDPSNCGGCFSSVFSGVCPGLSTVTQMVALNRIQTRDSVSIIQQPAAGNNYTLIVWFDDPDPGGFWYIIELDFPNARTCSAIPTMSEWGMVIFMVLAGFSAVYYLKRQKRV
jgi:hypothetical protein